MYTGWPCPLAGGGETEEMALAFDGGRTRRLLVLPAWFDEGNKLRRFTVEVMRRLDKSGIDCFCPDLPGCNESLQPTEAQTLAGWHSAVERAASHFACTHVLTVRAGALLAPTDLPGWQYAPIKGSQVLRAMLRARTIAAQEAGKPERIEELEAQGREHGVELAGWSIGPELFGALEAAQPTTSEQQVIVPQGDLGAGGGLWLRAEPDENPQQADALAAIVAVALHDAEQGS